MIQPILHDIPDNFETERLTIRAPRPGDGAPMRQAVLETLDSLRPWMSWAHEVATEEEYEEKVRRGQARFIERADLWLLLFLKGTDNFVGGSGLHHIDWTVPRFEIGYWCRQRFQGQGYITEAVRGITGFAFETLNAQRIEIRCDPANQRSRQVAARCGYVLEGILRNHSRNPVGELRDTMLFARIPEEQDRS